MRVLLIAMAALAPVAVLAAEPGEWLARDGGLVGATRLDCKLAKQDGVSLVGVSLYFMRFGIDVVGGIGVLEVRTYDDGDTGVAFGKADAEPEPMGSIDPARTIHVTTYGNTLLTATDATGRRYRYENRTDMTATAVDASGNRRGASFSVSKTGNCEKAPVKR
ncbi:hypothetical protein [Rhodoferax sp.]|uniref:hypothetical protein n=1 Tax=Rhodoferax sp. TaxID=50421 RepID=UPI002742E51B|nr:hypothetical protein [Rhodoferax sp.]